MTIAPQQEERTLGETLVRLIIVGRAKQYPPLEAIGLYCPAGVDAWAHWASWRFVAASRGDKAAGYDLAAAITLGEAYALPEPVKMKRRIVKAKPAPEPA